MADNVLWIITDDQMRSTLRAMDKTQTRLVEKGVRFRHGYTAMPWCGPARASLLTSRYPHEHGCHNNQTHQPFVAQGHDRDTIATRIRAAGYDTAYFGKYMNGLAEDPRYVAPGWRRWVATVGKRGQVNADGDVRDLETQKAADAFAAVQLRRFVERHQDTGPWFAAWAPSTPHDPYTASPEHRSDFHDVRWDPPAFNEADVSDKPSWMRDLPRQERAQMRAVLEGKLEELQDLDDHAGGSSTCSGGPTSSIGRGSSSSPTMVACSASTGSSARSSLTRSRRASRTSCADRVCRRVFATPWCRTST